MVKGFESYPLWMVAVSNLSSWSVYIAGLFVAYRIWPVLAGLLLLWILWLEYLVYREGCTSCYYFGKTCFSGKGRLAGLLFSKTKVNKFKNKKVSFKDFLPSLVPSILPLVGGIYLMLQSFSWLLLLVTVWPLFIWFFGNPIVYGELACPNCKQGHIACPVCEFFKKQAKKR